MIWILGLAERILMLSRDQFGAQLMPVTARLSKKLYDTFGEELAQEMVDWFNQVDATYRADLRELNELNFARFDAKLEQRLAELRAELRTEISKLRTELHLEIGQLRAELHTEIGQLRTELHTEIGQLRGEFRTEIGKHRTDLAAAKADVIRWMFLFWLGTVGTFIAVGRLMLG
jgi:DNA anti-recombination protein RmuC